MNPYRTRSDYNRYKSGTINYLYLVSRLTGISMRDILSGSRKSKIVEARQVCQYFYRLQNGIQEAGRILRRNHAAILHGYNVISESMPYIVFEIKNIKRTELNF